jgi:hypothetical protein
MRVHLVSSRILIDALCDDDFGEVNILLHLIENKPRRQGDDPWRRRLLRQGGPRYARNGPSVKFLLLLTTLLFGGAALLFPYVELPYVDLPGSLPTVHRFYSTGSNVRSPGNLPTFGDVDCVGGGGNGPNFIFGPVPVAPGDPHGLDRDGDGIGCE